MKKWMMSLVGVERRCPGRWNGMRNHSDDDRHFAGVALGPRRESSIPAPEPVGRSICRGSPIGSYRVLVPRDVEHRFREFPSPTR